MENKSYPARAKFMKSGGGKILKVFDEKEETEIAQYYLKEVRENTSLAVNIVVRDLFKFFLFLFFIGLLSMCFQLFRMTFPYLASLSFSAIPVSLLLGWGAFLALLFLLFFLYLKTYCL